MMPYVWAGIVNTIGGLAAYGAILVFAFAWLLHDSEYLDPIALIGVAAVRLSSMSSSL